MISVLLTLSVASTGCHKRIPITVPIERTPLDVPDPAPLDLDEVKWHVITKDTATSLINKLPERGVSPVFFGLDEQGLENLAVNMSKIRAYITQQQGIIQAYREYYHIPTSKPITDIKPVSPAAKPKPTPTVSNPTAKPTVQKPSGLKKLLGWGK